jgi:WD40 repeat protein
MTVGDDAKLRVWVRAEPEAEQRCSASIMQDISELAFSLDGMRLAIAASNDIVRILDLRKLWSGEGDCEVEAEQSFPTSHTGLIKGLAFCPDGKRLATASLDGTSKMWSVDSEGGTFGEELGEFPYRGSDGALSPVDEVALSINGKMLAATGFDGTLRVWDTSSHAELFGYSDPSVRLSGVAFGPDENYLLATIRTGNIQFYDLKVENLKKTAGILLERMGKTPFYKVC